MFPKRKQLSFNPVDYSFDWTDGWYTWNRDEAVAQARRDRDQAAKALKAQGWIVRKWSNSNQQITQGGIGTEHPEITLVCSVYMIDAERV